MSKASGSEETGVLLLIVLLLISTESTQLIVEKNTMDKTFHQKFLKCFEQLLCFEQWMKEDQYSRKDLPSAHKTIQSMLALFKEVVNWQEGNGMKFPKFHFGIHICTDISNFGSPTNFDGGPGESNHTEMAKNPSKRTQH